MRGIRLKASRWEYQGGNGGWQGATRGGLRGVYWLEFQTGALAGL